MFGKPHCHVELTSGCLTRARPPIPHYLAANSLPVYVPIAALYLPSVVIPDHLSRRSPAFHERDR